MRHLFDRNQLRGRNYVQMDTSRARARAQVGGGKQKRSPPSDLINLGFLSLLGALAKPLGCGAGQICAVFSRPEGGDDYDRLRRSDTDRPTDRPTRGLSRAEVGRISGRIQISAPLLLLLLLLLLFFEPFRVAGAFICARARAISGPLPLPIITTTSSLDDDNDIRAPKRRARTHRLPKGQRPKSIERLHESALRSSVRPSVRLSIWLRADASYLWPVDARPYCCARK